MIGQKNQKQPGYIFGGDTGISHEQLQAKRQIAQALSANMGRAPRDIGEGLHAIGNALAYRGMMKQIDEGEAQGRGKAKELIAAALMSGKPAPDPGFGTFDSSIATTVGTPFIAARSESQEIGDDTMATLGKPGAMSLPGLFDSLEQQHGLPAGYLARTAQIESGGNPNAQNPNSSAGGMFQFIDSTAQQYGLTDKADPHASARAAAQLAADNAAQLREVLGRDPTAAELYLAHQQGAGGAAKLLSNPNASAASVVGNDAVSLNGGNANMTAGDFANQWVGKFEGGSTPSAQPPQQDYSAFYEAFSSPWLDQGQRAMLMAELEDRKAADARAYDQWAQTNDPLRQMQIERAQLEIEQMRNPQPQKTTLMQNYDAAVAGGYEGDFVQYQTDIKKAGAAQNNITVGGGDAPVPAYPKAPNGYMYVRDPATGQVVLNEQGIATMAPIVGGPEDTSKQDAKAAQAAAQAEANRSSVVVDTAQEIRKILKNDGLFDLPEVGVIGSKLRGINQESADMAGMLETLKGMVVFDRLEKLKLASATGASGLGQVTEREIDLLGAQLGALKQDMSKERILATLDTIESVFGKLSPEAEAYLMGRSADLPTGSAQGLPSTPTAGGFNFSTMEVGDLNSIDIDSLTPEQQDALSRRYQELGY